MTKSKKSLIATLFMLICLVLALPTETFAKEPLDEIQQYNLIVDMRNDGTMDISYHIEWKVLDDESEGPLEWVKIGIPNSHVDEIEAKSDTISDISYMAESGDTFVRVDFDRSYNAGETVCFDFSIHQSYMYVIDKEDHLLRYSFTPGWFDEIEVKNISIRWNNFNVIKSNSENLEGEYLVWQASLSFGEKLNASVSYNLDAFNTNEDEQYVEGDDEKIPTILIIIIVIIFAVVVICLLYGIFINDDYDNHSGFGGGSSYHTTYIHHTSCVSHCACVSSCACACACAGGGRAGCSKKDFYGTKIKSDKLLRILDE